MSAQEYYPFGMMRQSQAGKYRFGFNGKENDNELKGLGNQQDYGFRIHDPRQGRFLRVDPLTKDYPWYTPYQFAGNKPIVYVDLDGLEEGVFPKLGKYGFAGIFQINSEDIKATFWGGVDNINRNINPVGILAHGVYGTATGQDLITKAPLNRATAFSDMGVKGIMLLSGERLVAGFSATPAIEMEMTANTFKGRVGSLVSNSNRIPETMPTSIINGVAYNTQAAKAIATLRAQLSSTGHKVGATRNIGIVEGQIAGESINGAAVIGEATRVGSGLMEMPQQTVFNIFTVNFSRAFDAEVKIFENLAAKFNKGSIETNRMVFGKITVTSELPVCPSYSGVMDQFRLMFPNVQVRFINGIQVTTPIAK